LTPFDSDIEGGCLHLKVPAAALDSCTGARRWFRFLDSSEKRSAWQAVGASKTAPQHWPFLPAQVFFSTALGARQAQA
jgi:hypothetical protein